ncbi:MAG: BrnA antitoxin family protein [Acidobacteria bacterium]|nr:BrnA antitoxin family protein [Acidobacteriota bacterium]
MKTTGKEIKIEYTQEAVDAMRAKGYNEDSIPSVGVHTFRRVHPDRVAKGRLNAKVRISIAVDLDILDYFKERAAKPDAAPYQTQINNELRRIMEADRNGEKTKPAFINDKDFLRELKEKLESV